MTKEETTNIYLELRKKGWSEAEIGVFITTISTHHPTEQEVIESNRKVMEREQQV